MAAILQSNVPRIHVILHLFGLALHFPAAFPSRTKTDLQIAYNFHNAQGSEYRAVVIPLLTQQYMLLQRNLLYTAITRARELVVLVGMKKAIAIAVRNDKIAQRNSRLAQRLTAA